MSAETTDTGLLEFVCWDQRERRIGETPTGKQQPEELHNPSADEVETHDSESASLAMWLGNLLGEVPDVVGVYFAKENRPEIADPVYRVWTHLRQSTPEARRDLYAMEARVLNRFRELEFDLYSTDSAPQDDEYFKVFER